MSSLERYLARAVLNRASRHRAKPRRRGLLALVVDYIAFPEHDRAFLAFVRTFPCLICGRHSEAAHTGTDGGAGLIASDRTAVNLCHRCHRTGPRSYHRIGRRAFERLHMIDFSSIVQRLNAEYARR